MKIIAGTDVEPEMASVVSQIEASNARLAEFWSKSDGWSPAEVALLLKQARLDWQVSLSHSLIHWVSNPAKDLSDGDLILGWVNLGALVEGTIKLFLTVYHHDYVKDIDGAIHSKTIDHKTSQPKSQDGLQFQKLIDYCKHRGLLDSDGLALSELVKSRRNSIHAFQDRDIGTGDELHAAIRRYFKMLQHVELSLPTP